MNLNLLLVKLDRFFAWVLFLGMFVYFISGYGMTKGLIDPNLATNLHVGWLPIAIIIAFIGHTAYAVHLALKRWSFWNGFSKFFLVLFYASFLIFFLYVDMFYKKPVVSTGSSTDSVTETTVEDQTVSDASSAATSGSATIPSEKTFSLSELAKYNGKNGQPAYVAVDGVVYDMTSVFANGIHYGHIAGTELSDAFYTRHAKSAITKYPVVGKLE